MLQVIREKTQGLVAWGIVAAIAIVFSLWGINNYTSGGKIGNVAAKVDGRKITWSAIDRLVDRQRQYLMETNPEILQQLDINVLRSQAKQYLIQQTALDSQIKRLGLLISEQQLAKKIASDPAFLVDGKFSPEKYHQFLQKIAEPEASFTESVRSGMQLDQLRTTFLQSSFIFDKEVDTIMDLFFQQRDFGFLVVPKDKFKANVSIDAEAIKNYYQQHQHMYVAPEQVKLAFVELTLDGLVKSIPINEEKLQEYYNKHLALFTIPEEIEVSHILINASAGSPAEQSGEAKAKIDDILAKIKLGEDFAELAKKYSEDTVSGANGGELGKIGRGQTVEAFDKAAFALANSGDVSEVVKTEYGYHIIKLGKKYPAYVQQFTDVRDLVADNYKRELAESQFAEKGEELANLAFEYSDSLQQAADKMQLKVQETELFSKNTGQGIAAVPSIINAAFTPEMLAKNKNSDLIKIDDESYAVIRVIEHVATRPLELAEVQDKIQQTLMQVELEKQAAEFGNKLLAQLKAGDKPHAVAIAADLEWQLAKDVERNSRNYQPTIMQHAFALPKPAEKQPVNVGFALPSGDYVVLALRKVKAGDKAKELAIKQQFQQQLAQAFAQNEFQLFELALIKNAKIAVTN